VVALIAFAAIGGSLTACRETGPPPPVAGRSQVDSADQFMIGMQTVLVDAGVRRANVEADSAFLYDNSVRIQMYGVVATFFTAATGVKNGVMTALRATYDTRADSMEAFGNVKVTSIEGETLTTPYLRYNKITNKISSDSAFTMTGPDRTVSGVGFDSDPGMNALMIHHGARGSAGTVQIPKR
jgi:LPS export ABC transporter protein LptC